MFNSTVAPIVSLLNQLMGPLRAIAALICDPDGLDNNGLFDN